MDPGRENPHRLGRDRRVGGGRGDLVVALVAAAVALIAVTLLAPAAALAATADVIAPSDPHDPTVESGWQAGTCSDEPPESTGFCSVATPGQFFERAAAHPNWGFTQFIVKHNDVLLEGKQPVGELETVHVDLPVGLSVNPGATERCPLATFEAGASGCPAGSEVGRSEVTVAPPPLYVPLPPAAPLTDVPVYNVIPPSGEPARFGLELAGNEVFLQASVDWSGDYHEGFTIAVPKALPIPGIEGLILKNRLVFDGRAGDGTFITTPSTCYGEAFSESGSVYSTLLLAASYEEEAQPGYSFPQSAAPRLESPIPPGTSPKECDTTPYAPTVSVEPGTAATESPAGVRVDVDVPHITGAGEQDSSDTRTARVTLPAGMGINPSAANGLRTCSDAQFGKGTANPVACPAASRIGSVTIASPPLPEGDLEGPVFVGQQLSRDPTSGNEYRIFADAESARYGISVRLVGNVRADPVTGQLTTTFADNPQVPFTAFHLAFDPGARAALSSPPTCGPHPTTTSMTPWSGNAPAAPSEPVRPQPGAGRRRLRSLAGGAPLRPRLPPRSGGRQGRSLQPALADDLPAGRRTGAERRRRHPGAGDDGQPRRHPVLLRGGAGGGRRARGRRRGGELELPGGEPAGNGGDRRRHRPAAPADPRQGLPLRPLPRGPSLPGSAHPRHGRAV